MTNYSYFYDHDIPKHKKINKRKRDSSLNDPRAKGKNYRDTYGL